MLGIVNLDKLEEEIDLYTIVMNRLDLESLKNAMLSKIKMISHQEAALAARVISYSGNKSSELTLDQVIRFLSVASRLDINTVLSSDQNPYSRSKILINEVLRSNNVDVIRLFISEAILRGDSKSLQTIKDAGQLHFHLGSFRSYIEKTVHVYTDEWKQALFRNLFFDESTLKKLQEILTEQFRIGKNIILSLDHMDFLSALEMTKFYHQVKALRQSPPSGNDQEKSNMITDQMKFILSQIRDEIFYLESEAKISDQNAAATAPVNSLFFHTKEVSWTKVVNKESSNLHHYVCVNGNLKDSTITIREASKLIKEYRGTIAIKLSNKINIHELARIDEELVKLGKLSSEVNRSQVSKNTIFSDYIFIFSRGDKRSKDFAQSIEYIDAICEFGEKIKEDILGKITFDENACKYTG